MRRLDIEVVVRGASITVLTKDNQTTFSPAGEKIALFSTAEFTMPMLDELESSKILEIESYTYSDDSGTVKINKKFGFTNEIFTDILIDLIEKHNL